MPTFLRFVSPFDLKFSACALAVAVFASTALGSAHAAAVSGQGTWETTLQGRDLDGNTSNGFEAYYDTALNISWLADANYAQTSGFDSVGAMGWSAATAWVAGLNVSGITGWRLPALVDTGSAGCDYGFKGSDCGYNVDTSTSEFAHLFHETLGNGSYYDTLGNPSLGEFGLVNTGPFSNNQTFDYWIGTPYAADAATAWYFLPAYGAQYYGGFKSEVQHPGFQ
jgi:hypothetical protein